MQSTTPEIGNLLCALKHHIEKTRIEYKAMMELRELVTLEYDIMFKEQLELRLDITNEIERMTALHQLIKDERQTIEQEKAKIKIRALSRSLPRSLTPPKSKTKTNPMFTIGTIGALAAKRQYNMRN